MGKIGKNIKKIRNIKGLSQQAFADIFNLTRGNISSYEELRAEPKIETVLQIANYFSIPLTDFIQKELSVNELLHFDTSLVVEMEKLKQKDKFVEIPYVSSSNLGEYISNFKNYEYLQALPQIHIPNTSHFTLLAIEVDNSQNFPEGFSYKSGDVLIYESIEKENIHRIAGRLGIKVDQEGIKTGIFEKEGSALFLVLNEWVKYEFAWQVESEYWVVRAVYSQEI